MKTTTKFSLLSLSLVCALTACAPHARAQGAKGNAAAPAANSAKPESLPARPVADKLAPAGWTRYEIGRPMQFSLILPGEPLVSTERMVFSPTLTVTVSNYISLGESGLYGAIHMSDLPVELMNEAFKRTYFESFIKGFARGFEAGMSRGDSTAQMQLLELRAATAAGLAGYEQDLAFDKMKGRVRLVYDGARAYAVLSFWSDPAMDADRAAFFKSLRVGRRR